VKEDRDRLFHMPLEFGIAVEKHLFVDPFRYSGTWVVFLDEGSLGLNPSVVDFGVYSWHMLTNR